MFKSFSEYLISLDEAKNVGVIYHFTKLESLQRMLDDNFRKEYDLELFEFISYNGKLSCTRDYCLSTNLFSKDITEKKGYKVRISLDGNKISNKFKIKPVKGFYNDRSDHFSKEHKDNITNSEESEEMILPLKNRETFKMKDYISRIDFLNTSSENEKKILDEIIKKLISLNIEYNISRKWESTKINESQYFENLELEKK